MSILNLNKRFSVLFVFCVFLCSALTAQTSDLDVSLRYGFPDIKLQAVFKAKDQVFYLATNRGIYSYNGSNLHFIDITGLQPDVSRTIFVSGDSLWIGDKTGGLTILEISSETIKFQKQVSEQPISQIKTLSKDIVLVIAEGEGMAIFKDGNLVKVPLNQISDNYINDIALNANDNRIAIATDRGVDILSYNSASHEIVWKEQVAAENDLFRAVSWQNDELLYLGDETALQVYGKESKSGDKQLIGTNFNGKIYDGFNSKWAADENDFLHRLEFNSKNEVIRNTTINLSESELIDLYPLVEGYMIAWFSNGNYSLIPANHKIFQSINQSSLEGITAVSLSNSNSLWLALKGEMLQLENTSNYGLQIVKRISLPTSVNYPIIQISFWQDYLIASTFGEGLFVYNLKDYQLVYHFNEANGLDNNSVLDVAADSTFMWVSTLSGIQKISFSEEPIFKTIANSPGYVYDLLVPYSGGLYAGSQGESVAFLKNEELISLDTLNFKKESILSMVMTKNKTVWGISPSSQLYEISPNGLIGYSQNEHLAKLELYELIESKDGQLALLSANGIYLINSTSILTEAFWSPSLFNSNYQHIAVCDSTGVMFVAGQNALIAVDKRIFNQSNQPKVWLNAIYANHILVTSDKFHQFAPEEVDLTFSFSAPWFDPYRPLTHEYRLIGLDSVWRTTSGLELFFPKLAPGNYELQFKTSFVNSNSSIGLIKHSFSIATPFYNRLWFYALIATTLIVLTFLVVRNRELSKTKALRAESERVQGQFEVLKNQINPHFLFNSFNTLAAMIGSNPAQAEEYTEKLSAYFRQILSVQEEDVVSLEQELKLAKDFIFLQRSRYGSALDYKTEIEPQHLQRKLPVMALQILLENAIKHNSISKLKPLSIIIKSELDSLVITNNIQPKPSPPPSTGVGLANLSNRLRILFNKDLKIDKSEGIFKVIIPFES